MKRFLPFLLLLLCGAHLSAAVYNVTPSFNLQKLTREATSTVEDTYNFTLTAGPPTYVQLIATTQGVFIHSTAGSTQSDGFPIPAGVPFTFKVETTLTLYLSAQTGTGTVDMIVLHQ